ncbi:MAG: SDR family oxidoreductase [Planctomycetota bacterium]|jgi:2-deoxy-D-gluconate 3-dehydrogenase|nr:SDR family oxidoreductase [Planctomycetota bacterium]
MSILNAFQLTGQTALVTGCNRGIGLAMAVALAEAGADIIGVSATIADDGGPCGAAVREVGRSFTAIRCDFADRAAVTTLCDQIRSQRIDILVNNAGTIRREPAVEHRAEWWDEVIEVNLNAQFFLSQAAASGMLERGHGKIVFTASLLSYQGGITVPGYAAAKGGIAQLTKALANEWAAKGINVNAIAPGYIATDNTAALRADPEREPAIRGRIPAGRWGEATDLAGATVFLCSAAANYVHGTILPVDGGWLGR